MNLNICIQIQLFPNFHNKITYVTYFTPLTYLTYLIYLTYLPNLPILFKTNPLPGVPFCPPPPCLEALGLIGPRKKEKKTGVDDVS